MEPRSPPPPRPDRRRPSGAAATAAPARAAPAAPPISALGVDASQFGLRARQLRRPEPRAAARHRRDRAHARAACHRARRLPRRQPEAPGRRAAHRRARRNQDSCSRTAPRCSRPTGADHVTLSGLVLDGGKRPLPERRGLRAAGKLPQHQDRRLRDQRLRPQRPRLRRRRRRGDRHGDHRHRRCRASTRSMPAGS